MAPTLSRSATVPQQVVRYVAILGAGATAGFALLNLPAIKAGFVVPVARLQGTVVAWWLGVPALPIAVVPDCSGLDVLVLCAVATLAYPVSWRQRATGALLGMLALALLNLVRLASLSVAVRTPMFDALHHYVWPAALLAAAALWMAGWIRVVEGPLPGGWGRATGTRRFAAWSAGLLAVYVVAIPLLTMAQVLDQAARDLAGLAAWLLAAGGIDAALNGHLLTARGASFLVTADCVTTPLMPLYLAAAVSLAPGWRSRLAGLALFLPVFTLFGLLRLFTVALPPLGFGSPLVLTHGFYQLLLGGIVLAAAAWATRRGGGLTRGAAAAAFAVSVGAAGILWYTPALAAVIAWLGAPVPGALLAPAAHGDAQGALALLPAYQLGLFAGLCAIIRARITLAGLVAATTVLLAAQIATLWGAALAGHDATLAIRAWSVALPAALALALWIHGATRPELEEVPAWR